MLPVSNQWICGFMQNLEKKSKEGIISKEIYMVNGRLVKKVGKNQKVDTTIVESDACDGYILESWVSKITGRTANYAYDIHKLRRDHIPLRWHRKRHFTEHSWLTEGVDWEEELYLKTMYVPAKTFETLYRTVED